MNSRRGEPSLHGWPEKQIPGNVPAALQYFYFDQQSEKILQAFQKLELLEFFLLIGVLLMLSYFLKHLLNQAWWLMIQSGLCVCVHVIIEKNLLVMNLTKFSHGMDRWWVLNWIN